MGIFDRAGGKKGDTKPAGGPQDAPREGEAHDGYDDAPVQNVSLTGARPAAAAPAAQPAHEEDVRPSYGIENAIQLMRALPVDQNVELVVGVIKTTLESLKVKVSDIIGDATRKQKDLESRVTELKKQITDFEREIQQRKEEIARLEADQEETTRVKERLELAEGHASGGAAAKAKAARG